MRKLPSISAAIGFGALLSAASPPLQAEPPDGWRMVFNDEFDAAKLDAEKWSTTMEFPGTHGPRYHNEYYQSYTLDEEAVLGSGMLRLRTDRRTVKGTEPPGIFKFSQALVSTHDKFAFSHGYIEIRAKFPGGKGLWPCFWLMPQNQTWPPEFDIAEYYGGQKKMHHGLAHGTMTETLWDSTGDSETKFENVWRTYALEWTPGRAVWSVDGREQKVVEADYVPSCAMYIVLSNSVSSKAGPPGAPDAKTVFPNEFVIDYVRVFQPPLEIPAEPGIATAEVVPDAPAQEADPEPDQE